MTKKHILNLSLATILLFFITAPVRGAENKNSVASISFGGYQTTDGTDTLDGSQLAISYLRHFSKHWAYFVRLSNGSASGTHTENGEKTDLSANTTTLTGGIRWNYDLDLNSNNQDDLTPYIGAGLSVQNYTYDFDYPDSDVGKTSGTGYGPFLTLGLKMAVAKNIVLIPGYHYQQITIKTEDGSSHSFTSSGLSLAFVARF